MLERVGYATTQPAHRLGNMECARQSFVAMLVLAALLNAGACTSNLPDAMRSRFISIDRDGYGLDKDNVRLTTEAFTALVQGTIVAGIQKQLRETASQGKPLRLLVFIHGGMNGPSSD